MAASDIGICTVTAIMMLVMTISCIQSTVFYIIHLHGQNTNALKRQMLLSSLASWISNVGFTLTGILILVQMLSVLIIHEKSTLLFQFTVRISMFLYLLSETLMILAFTFRVNISLKHSTFGYSTCTIHTLYVFVWLLLLLFVLAMIALLLQLYTALLFVGVIWYLLYCILCITLVVLFTRKMEQIICQHMRNMEKSELSPGTTIDLLIDEELLYIVIKHGILVPIAIVSSFVCSILAVCLQFVSGWTFVTAFLYAADSFVNGVCVYMLFAFNRRVYDILCGPLHRVCERCKRWQMKRKLIRSAHREMTDKTLSLEVVETNSNPSKIKNPKPELDEIVISNEAPKETNTENIA